MAPSNTLSISQAQCRAARGLLGWTQSDLAREAGLSKTAIVQFETSVAGSRSETLRVITQAFIRHGVEFSPPHGVNRRAIACRLFADPLALGQDWPDFLRMLLTELQSSVLTAINWPDFHVEFTAVTGLQPIIEHKNTLDKRQAVVAGDWIIMPIAQTPFRMALQSPSVVEHLSGLIALK